MIFSVIIIVFVLGVTYMHFLQGAFTSVISMACALAATLVAFGYYENVVNLMSQGGMTDFAGGMSLIGLFIVTYGVLRVLADMLVPGNIALQLYVEKVCAVVFGLGAAILGAGTFAVGVQMMPMGGAVAGYARYELRDREVSVPATLVGRQRGADTSIVAEVVPDKFDGTAAALLLPADGLVLSLVKYTSDGSLNGTQSFTTIHPDLITEAFSNRVGGEGSGKHVALNSAKQQNVTLDGLYILPAAPKAFDSEVIELRPSKLNVVFKPLASDVYVVVRAMFSAAVNDKDAYVRITPAAARLVVKPAGEEGQTFYPIGSMETATLMALHRIDDVLPVPVQGGAHGVDLVYALPKSVAETFAKKAAEGDVRFVELKLFGRIDLAEKTTERYPGPSPEVRVMRKPTSPLGKEMPVAAPKPA